MPVNNNKEAGKYVLNKYDNTTII